MVGRVWFQELIGARRRLAGRPVRDKELAATVRELLDRQSIADCIRRYARGVDRFDDALVASAYHLDAVEDHGPVRGSPREFIAWYRSQQPPRSATLHCVANQMIELHGNEANAETYFFSLVRYEDGADATLVFGRYVDHLTRRDGEWRIASRILVREGRLTAHDASEGMPNAIGRRDRSDVSYKRTRTP
jgi:hypothetical protein